MNHIDTAQFYGPDVVNDLIRQALFPYPPDLAIVTKVGYRRNTAGRILLNNHPDELRASIVENLTGLRVAQVAAVNLRLSNNAAADSFFDEQLGAMIRAKDEGLIAGIGLSNITLAHLSRALELTQIVCVQNLLNPAELSSLPVLRECTAKGIAFVPFFSLGAGNGPSNPVLGDPRITRAAARLRVSPAQVALAWALELAPNLLVIPGSSSRQHLVENIDAQQVELDELARRELPWTS